MTKDMTMGLTTEMIMAAVTFNQWAKRTSCIFVNIHIYIMRDWKKELRVVICLFAGLVCF